MIRVNVNMPINILSHVYVSLDRTTPDLSLMAGAAGVIVALSIITAILLPRKEQTRVHKVILADYSNHASEIELVIRNARAQMNEAHLSS